MMDVISGATKKGEAILRMAESNIGEKLYDVYTTYSAKKAKAYDRCIAEKRKDKGYNFHICSANTYQFTVAWEYVNQETGEIMTKVKTACNTYIVDGSRKEN